MKISVLWSAACAVCLVISPVVRADPSIPQVSAAAGVELSPALAGLMRTVLDNHPRARAARAAVDAADARVRAAESPLYNPEIELETERAESDTTTLGLKQAIDWSDKRAGRGNVAAQELSAAQAELHVVRQLLAGELLNGLANYHTAEALSRLAQERTGLTQRLLTLAEQRQQVGDLTQIELELARLAHTQSLLQQAQAVAQRADAEQSLVAVVGVWPTSVPSLPERFPNLGVQDSDRLVEQLPELRAQQARIAAARETITLRQREQRPDPTLSVRGGHEDAGQLVGLSLSIPLYVRNSYRAETQVASAELMQAVQTGEDALRRAQTRLQSAAERYQLTRQAWSTWESSGDPSLGKQMELLERIWQAGELSTADYLVQLNQVLETRSSAFGLRGDVWKSWFEWLAASGYIDQWLNNTI